jgi:PAS domain S-box-containing protein
MYQKDNLINQALVLVGFTILIFFFFFLQNSLLTTTPLFFAIAFITIFFVAVETVSTKVGLYIASVSVILEIIDLLRNGFTTSSSVYLSIFLILGFTFYYFLIKTFKEKKLEDALERERHFRSLVDFTLQPLILKNEKGEVIYASESIKNVLGLKTDLTAGETLENFIHPRDIFVHKKFFTEVLNSPNKKRSIEIRMKKEDADWIWVRNDAINLLGHKKIKAVVTSIQDITFQKELDREKVEIISEEIKARNLAERAVRDRDEFLSIASHELKTPLTTVLLQLQSTLRRISSQSLADFSGAQLLKSLQIAEVQSKTLGTYIKDLLNVSLASTGRITLNKETMNLSETVRGIVQRMEEEIKISGCNVDVFIKEDIIGNWDPVRIEQLVTNLFTNALKHAKGSKINLTVGKDVDWAIFKVKDEGPGIRSDLLNEIFEPFKQGNKNSNQGLGVGLFIAKRIALAHGGDIEVKNNLRRGATFTLKLPLS